MILWYKIQKIIRDGYLVFDTFVLCSNYVRVILIILVMKWMKRISDEIMILGHLLWSAHFSCADGEVDALMV
jgi:hypothetical protein